VVKIFIALLALTSAALADPPAAALPPLDPANARVVIVRESSVMAAIANAKIYLDAEKIGAVANGEVLVFDHAPGHFDLVFDNPLNFFGGDLKLPVDLAAGQTVYVKLGGMIGRMGAVGADIEAEHAQTATCSKDWCATTVPADTAATLMAGMTVNQVEKPK
jgi:hypothetical protein